LNIDILDITNSSNPEFLGKIKGREVIGDITSKGDTLIISANHSLIFYDVSNPRSPIHLTTFNPVSLDLYEIEVYNQYLLVGTYGTGGSSPGGITVYDMSNIYDISYVNFLQTNGTELIISEDVAYSRGPTIGGGVYYFSLQDMMNLERRAMKSYFSEIFVKGNYFFGREKENAGDKFQIYEIDDNLENNLLVEIDRNYLRDFILNSDSLILIFRDSLEVFDISDPSDPVYLNTILSNVDIHYNVSKTLSEDKKLYSNNSSGFGISNAEDLSNIYQESYYSTGHYGTDSKVYKNDFLLMPSGESGITVLDISDITSPVLHSKIITDKSIYEIQIMGNYLYTRIYNHQNYKYDLLIYDISQIDNPVLINAIESVSNSFALYEGFLYILDVESSDKSTLNIFNVAHPDNPELVNSIEMIDTVNCVLIRNNKLGVFKRQFLIYDLTNPQYPQFEYKFELADSYSRNQFYEFYPLGDYLFIDEGSELIIYKKTLNIQNVSFTRIKTYEVGNWAISSKVLYLFQGSTNLYTFDITDPGRRRLLESVPQPHGKLATFENYLFLNSIFEGLIIFKNNYLPDPNDTVNNNNSSVSAYKLYQNYPNPFNPFTTISYSIPEEAYVTLKLYDILGEEIASLVNKTQPAGNYEVKIISEEHSLSSGVYLYQLKAGIYIDTKKCVLLK
jgi:hypothetical protein